MTSTPTSSGAECGRRSWRIAATSRRPRSSRGKRWSMPRRATSSTPTPTRSRTLPRCWLSRDGRKRLRFGDRGGDPPARGQGQRGRRRPHTEAPGRSATGANVAHAERAGLRPARVVHRPPRRPRCSRPALPIARRPDLPEASAGAAARFPPAPIPRFREGARAVGARMELSAATVARAVGASRDPVSAVGSSGLPARRPAKARRPRGAPIRDRRRSQTAEPAAAARDGVDCVVLALEPRVRLRDGNRVRRTRLPRRPFRRGGGWCGWNRTSSTSWSRPSLVRSLATLDRGALRGRQGRGKARLKREEGWGQASA